MVLNPVEGKPENNVPRNDRYGKRAGENNPTEKGTRTARRAAGDAGSESGTAKGSGGDGDGGGANARTKSGEEQGVGQRERSKSDQKTEFTTEARYATQKKRGGSGQWLTPHTE